VRNRAIFSKPTDVLAELFEESAERAAKAQKTMLDYAASQNRAVSDLIRNHAGTAAAPVVRATDSLEKGFDQAIEAQKELLETGVKLLKRA
jgi:predicted secreted protein